MIQDKSIAEQMTGIRENPSGIGQFYDDDGNVITHEQAIDLLMEGKSIAVPNAGAGSYREVLEALGFTEVETMNLTSSGGDWSFGAKNSDGAWYGICQSNRHPHFGFTYCLAEPAFPFNSFDELSSFFG